MTLSAILADLYRRLALPAVPNTTETVRLTSFVNTTHRQILGLPGMDRLRDTRLTFVSAAGFPEYALPQAVARIQAISDGTNFVKLVPLPLDTRRADVVPNEGIPTHYVNTGFEQVLAQPTVPVALWAVSSSALDTQNVFYEGFRGTQGFSVVGGATSLTGTVPVVLGTDTDHTRVTRFYLDTAGTGQVDLRGGTPPTGDLLASIPPGATSSRYLWIELYPTPSSANTYYVDAVRTVTDLAQVTDEPLLPEDFHWLLVEGALLKEWTKRDDDRRIAAEREYAKGLSALRYFINAQGDEWHVSGRDVFPARSRFGPWYPATWY